MNKPVSVAVKSIFPVAEIDADNAAPSIELALAFEKNINCRVYANYNSMHQSLSAKSPRDNKIQKTCWDQKNKEKLSKISFTDTI